MSSYGFAANLLTQLSINTIHPRLFPLQWMRRNAVRCFSQNSGGSGLPVRFISKRRQEANQTLGVSSVDISLKDGVPSSSESSVSRCKSSEGTKGVHVISNKGNLANAESKLSNALLDSNYELNHRERYGGEITVKKHIKVREQAVDSMKVAEVVAQESLAYNRGDQHEVLTYNRDDQSEGFKLNEELSNDGLVDEEHMEAPEEVFEEAQLSNGNAKGKPDETKQAAEKLAVQLLAKRAFTAVELRKKLSAKQFPLNTVEAVLRDFQNRGLINDGLYAETFSHSRWKSSSWGPRRIKQALTVKGVSENDVKKAVKLVFEDPEEGDQMSSIKLSSTSLHQLYIQASKQWQRSQNAPHETRKTRVIRWLQYRGFDWSVIGTIMKKLLAEYPR